MRAAADVLGDVERIADAQTRYAVSGINCIRPCAPLSEIAFGLNADSAWITARNNAGSTPNSVAAAAISSR